MATATKVNADREAEMQSRGMRRITFWVPDTTEPAFEKEYRRQMAILSEHYRQTDCADLIELDKEDLRGWT